MQLNRLFGSDAGRVGAVLDARAAHPNATLADLYDPLTMPPDLVKAHAHLDALVDKAYGLSPSCTDADRVAHLYRILRSSLPSTDTHCGS